MTCTNRGGLRAALFFPATFHRVMHKSLCALAAAAMLILSAPVWGQSPKTSVDAARTLVKQGQYDAALAILQPLLAHRPVPADVVFLIGLAAIGASQKPGLSEKSRDSLVDAAITALHSMLVSRPGLVRVRLELARAFFLKGEDALARRHFEQVLAGKPPAGVVLNVNRFLAEIRARKRWSMRVGVALAPDSNIGAGSDERIIYIDIGGVPLPFTLDDPTSPASGIGISAWLGGEYQLPLGKPGSGSGASLWRLRAGGDIQRREYKESRFDRMTVSGHVGPRWLIGRGSEASLLMSGLHQWTGKALEEPSHHDIGLRVEGRHRLGQRTTVNARASWHERRYDKEDHRDGPIVDLSLGTSWAASPTARMDAGAGWGRERTETERWRNSWRWVRVGATVALPWGFTVGGSGTLRWTEYQGNWFPFVVGGEPRSDITRTIRVFAHNRAFTVQGFSPQISVTQEQRTTNAQLHDYERTSGELRFVRLF